MSTLTLTADFPHSPRKVWHAIATREAMNAWLMPNDFEPVVGRAFTFRTDPAPGFDGIVHCQVLAVEPPHRLVYSWKGGPLDTLVTYVLEPLAGGGTRLHFTHDGFHGLKQRLIGGMLGRGWKRMLRRTLPGVLDRMDEYGHVAPLNGLHGASAGAGADADADADADARAGAHADAGCHKGLLTRLRVALVAMVPGGRRP